MFYYVLNTVLNSGLTQHQKDAILSYIFLLAIVMCLESVALFITLVTVVKLRRSAKKLQACKK